MSEELLAIESHHINPATDFGERWADGFSWLLAGLLIGNTTYLIGIYLVGFRAHRINYFSNVYLIIPFLGGSFGLIRLLKVYRAKKIIRNTYREAVAWLCLGLFLWSVGCAIGMVYSFILDKPVPFPWWGDLFFASCFICWTIGLTRIYDVAGVNFLEELRNVSTYLIFIAAGAVALVLNLFRQYRNSLTASSSISEILEVLADIFFPLIDLFNLALLFTLLPRPANNKLDPQIRPHIRALRFGYLFLCIASISFTICNKLPVGTPYAYYNGGFTDAMFATGFTILSISVSRVSFKELGDTRSIGGSVADNR